MFPTFLLYLKKATKWWFLPIMVAAGFFVILSAIKNVRYTFTMFAVPGNFSLISKSNRHDCLMAVRVEISVGCRLALIMIVDFLQVFLRFSPFLKDNTH